MKAMMISGAISGFVIGAGGSLLGGGTMQTAFWHAAVAALAGGWLGRWCGSIWFGCLTDIIARQQREWQEAQNAALEAQMKKRPVKIP
jgi:hypothetical protein